MNTDLAGLLDAAGAADTPISQNSASGEKRRKLRHYDLLPAQLLNPMGASGVESVDLRRLWRSMSAGNKVVAAFSELCLEDSQRHGVGLSRFAEVMVLTIQRLMDTPHYSHCIKEELWTSVRQECEQILPSFTAIHAGRGGMDAESSSIRSVAYHRPVARAEDLTDHAAMVHAWLSKPSSPLRSVIAMLSAGGLFYVAQCHEKGARAWLEIGGGSLQAMQEAVTARRAAPADPSPDDYAALQQR